MLSNFVKAEQIVGVCRQKLLGASVYYRPVSLRYLHKPYELHMHFAPDRVNIHDKAGLIIAGMQINFRRPWGSEMPVTLKVRCETKQDATSLYHNYYYDSICTECKKYGDKCMFKLLNPFR